MGAVPTQTYITVSEPESLPKDLKIDDDIVYTLGETFESYEKELNDAIGTYVEIMKNITDTGIQSGETHDALVSFTEYVESLIGVVEQHGKDSNTNCKRFIQDVDEKDSFLY